MSVEVARSTVDSVCNQLASMIVHLKEIAPDFYASPETRRSAVLSEAQEKAINELLSAHPALKEPGGMLRGGFPFSAEDAIRHWEYYNEPVPFFHLLRAVEEKLDIEETLKLIGERPFVSLNSNREETDIYILPRVRSIHDPLTPDDGEDEEAPQRKHWAGEWNYGINQDLKNIFYVESEDLTIRGVTYTIRNIVLTSPILEDKDDFMIALSPVVSDAELDKRYSKEKSGDTPIRYFSVHGIKNAERVHGRIKSSFLEACQAGADMAVFPEMLGDAWLLEPDKQFSSMIDSMIEEAEEQEHPAPHLTLMPTWWHDGRNELYVISNKNERLCIQQKQNPFILEEGGQEYLEKLACANHEVQILHIDGFGRITFPICKDLLVQDYGDLLIKVLHSTFAICPSFSPGKTQFDLTAAKGRPYGCYMIWINTCSAVEGKEPPDHVGWIACPFPKEAEQRLCPDCKGNCGEDSSPCLFLIRISLDREHPDVEVKAHIHIRDA